jgi:hypothetical protein
LGGRTVGVNPVDKRLHRFGPSPESPSMN